MNRRRLSPEERTLWKDVTRSIAPLSKRRSAALDDAESAEPLHKASAKTAAKSATKNAAKAAADSQDKSKSRPAPSLPAAIRPVARPEPAPVPLGRKARRRLARGADAIGARLDLHGLTQDEAHGALMAFLGSARARGEKVVLVITGKGGGDGHGGRGVLKRQVPMWLRLPEFRDFVVGFETAGIGHGGEGALYVRLRRTRT